MGQVADIVTSPDWQNKSSAEKAAARPDLFKLSVEENPALQQAMSATDQSGQQQIFDNWSRSLSAKFPDAFQTDGTMWRESPDAKGELNRETIGVPIADYATEKAFDAAQKDPATAKQLWQSIQNITDPAQRKQSEVFYALRMGDVPGGKIPDELISEDMSGAKLKALRIAPAAIRMAGMIGGGAAGSALTESPLGAPAGSAAGAAIAEPAAQKLEKMSGLRQDFSATDALTNIAFAGIPLGELKVASGARGLIDAAAIRAGQGAALGAGQNLVYQIKDGKPIDIGQLSDAAVGGGFGGAAFGALEKGIQARIVGKPPSEAVPILEQALAQAPTEEAKVPIQQAIDEFNGIKPPGLDTERIARAASLTDTFADLTPKSAEESAGTLAAVPKRNPAQELQDTMESNQAASDGSSPLLSGADRQIEALDAQQRAAVPDEELPDMSAQAQSMYDKYGYVNKTLLGALAGGGSGAVYGSTQGDTLKDRALNAGLYGLVGAAGGAALMRGLSSRLRDLPVEEQIPVIEEQVQNAASPALKTQLEKTAQILTAKQRIIEKYPEVFNADAQIVNSHLPVEVRGANGEVYPALMNGYYDLGDRTIPSIAREVKGGWSHGMLKDGEKIISPHPTADQWTQGVREVNHPDPIVTVMDMNGRRAVQVEVPGVDGERPAFSGSPEEAADRGYISQLPEDLPAGQYKYSDLQSNGLVKSESSPQPNQQTSFGGDPLQQGLASAGKQNELGQGSGVAPEEHAPALTPEGEKIRQTQGSINPVLARALSAGAGFGTGFSIGFSEHPNDPVEDRLERGLVVGVIGAGGGYALGSSFLRLAEGSPPKSSSAEVQRWYKRLGQSDSTDSLAEKIAAAPNRFRKLFTTHFAPLDLLPKQIAEANGTPINKPALPLSKSFELVNGASGKGAVDVQDYNRNVLSQVKPSEMKQFNALLAIKRTGQRLQSDMNLVAEQARISSIPKNQWTVDESATMEQQPDRRRVAGETLASVNAALSGLEKDLGKARFAELDQLAAGPLQQAADKALQIQVAAGRLSPEAYAAIKTSNDFYAPFRVLDAAEEFDGFKGTSINPVDTTVKYTHAIKGIDSLDFHIDDPAQVMAEKIFQARVLAEKNLKMLELAKLADEDASGTVIKKLTPNTSAPKGMATVNYFENGVPRQMAVAPEIAEAVKGLNPAQTGVIANFIRAVNRPFRFGATAGNIAFQTVNAPADQFRLATTSNYGLGRGSVMDSLRYPGDFVHSLYTAMLNNQGAATAAGSIAGFYGGYQTGTDTRSKWENALAGAVVGGAAGRLAQSAAMRASNALKASSSPTLQQIGKTLDPTELYRQFYQSGSAGATMQDFIARLSGQTTATKQVQHLLGGGILSTLEDFGKAVEESTKLLGFKRGLRIEGIANLPPQQAADKLQQVVSEVRNFAGSPDFAVSGSVARDLNTALVFLNPRIQGFSEDTGRLLGRDGTKAAVQAWTALASTVGLASAYLWYRNNSPENAADYAQVSPDEKNRYAMIPRYDESGKPLYFTNDRGQKVRDYYRIPLRDTAQNLYQLVHGAVDYANNKDPKAAAQFGMNVLEDISPVNFGGKNTQERIESAISNLGPVGQIPYMLASQRNPGTHSDIIQGDVMKKASPTNQFTGTTPEIYKSVANVVPQWLADPLRSPLMLQQLTQAATGGVFNQFTPNKPLADRDATANMLEQSPLGRRFVRSTYVYDQAPQAATDALTAQADAKVSQSRDAAALYDQIKATPLANRAALAATLTDAQKTALVDEIKKRAGRPADQEIALVKQMGESDGVRAKYLVDSFSKMSPADRASLAKRMMEAHLLTPTVASQMSFLLSHQPQTPARN